MKKRGTNITLRNQLELHTKTVAIVTEQLKTRYGMLRTADSGLRESEHTLERRSYHMLVNLQHSLIDLLKLVQSQSDQHRFHDLVSHIAACQSWDYYWQHIPDACKRLGINIERRES